MKSMKKNIVVICLCAIGILVSLFACIVVPRLKGSQTPISDKEYEATIDNYQQNEDGYLIKVQGCYGKKIFINNAILGSNWNPALLTSNTKIYFRINKLQEPIEDMLGEEIYALTLRTEENELVSLEDYYNWEAEGKNKIMIAGIVVSAGLLGLIVFNVVRIVNKKRKCEK